MSFDPDEYLKEPFDPDAYLGEAAKENAGYGTAIASNFAGIGNLTDTAFTSLAGVGSGLMGDLGIPNSPFGKRQNTAEIEDALQARIASRNQWANPENKAIHGKQKFVGAAVSILPGMVAAGLSPAETVKSLMQSGESTATALTGGAVDAFGNVVGMLPGAKFIPGIKNLGPMARMALGGGTNAAQEAATKQAISSIATTDRAKEQFAPTVEDTTIAGLLGAGGGLLHRRDRVLAKPKVAPNVSSLLDELAAPEPKPAEAPIVDTRDGLGLSKEAYQQALREKELQRQSAFNRPDELGQLEQQSPMERMASQLGAEKPTPEVGMSPMDRMARDLAEAPTPEKRMAGERADAMSTERQRLMDEDVKRQTLLDQNAASRGRQEVGTIPVDQEKHPFVKAAEDKVDKAERILLKMTSAAEEGHPATATQLVRAKRDLADLQARADKVRANVSKERMPASPAMKALQRKQGGKVLVDSLWDAKDKDRTSEPSSTDLKVLTEGIRRNGIKKPITITVSTADGKGYVTDGNNRLAAAKQLGMKDIPYKVETTNVPFTQEQLGKAKTVSELGLHPSELAPKAKSQEALDAEAWLNSFNSTPTPFNYKNQGGGVNFGWGQKKVVDRFSKVPGIKEAFRDIGNAMIETPEAAISLAKQFPDVQQNVVQRGINALTKGGIYLKSKVDNPVVHFSVDRFLDADSKARGEINAKLNGVYLDSLRNLSKDEYQTAFTLLNAADLGKKTLTPELLAKHGLSTKLQEFVRIHQSMMDDVMGKINSARASVGKPPIPSREAYSAMSMSGDYRKIAYKTVDGERKVVGVLGADRKAGKVGWTLEKAEKAMLEKDPTLEFGPLQDTTAQRSFRGTPHEAFQDALATLGENNPHMAEFLATLKEVAKDDPTNYMGMQKHTMQKKGVWGMEGRKPWMTEQENATAFFENQVRYMEGAYQWSHLAEAAKDVNTVLRDPAVAAKHEKAIGLSEQYMQNALGLNPSRVGRAVNEIFNAVGDKTGLGPSNVRAGMQMGKAMANTMMLSLNESFLAIQILQAPAAIPGLTALLRGRGLAPTHTMLTGGLDYIVSGSTALLKSRHGMGQLSNVDRGAIEYARKNHIYATDMVEHTNQTTKGSAYWATKVTQTPAAIIESGTRAQTYMAFVKMMHDSGMKPADGLYQQAHRITDQAMNNYGAMEKPAMYNALGPIGSLAYNLKSFGHNEISRWSMLAREIGKTGNPVPLLTQMASTIVMAGVMGLPFFSQWEELYDFITSKLKAPRSLTLDVLDASEKMAKELGSDADKFKYVMSNGAATMLGADISKRVGLGDVLPSKVSDVAFPGGGKLASMATTAYGAVKHLDEPHAKAAAIAWLPSVVASPLKEAWYTKGDLSYSMDPDKPTVATARLNETDKLLKKVGISGINESAQKEKLFKQQQVTKAYADIKDKGLVKMSQEIFAGKPLSKEAMTLFLKGQGDPSTLEASLTRMALAQGMSKGELTLIKSAASNSLSKMYELQRSIE